MKTVEPAVAIGIHNGNDFVIGHDGRLYLSVNTTGVNADIRLTGQKVTQANIDFLIECLQHLRTHAVP